MHNRERLTITEAKSKVKEKYICNVVTFAAAVPRWLGFYQVRIMKLYLRVVFPIMVIQGLFPWEHRIKRSVLPRMTWISFHVLLQILF